MKLIGYDSDSGDDFPLKHRHIAKNAKGLCCYCSIELNRHNFTRDHIHPKSLGGRITRPCCRTCNSEKANKTLTQYMQYLGRQLFKMTQLDKRDTLGWRQTKHKIENIEKLMTLKADQL